MAAPHSAWHGRGGSWKAPCSQLVCGEGRDGRSPRCFQQEQNSRSTWMPFGVRLELGRGRCWSSALAESLGRGSRRWACVRPGGPEREGWRQEAAPGGSGSPRSHWGHHSFAPLPHRPSSGVSSVSFRAPRAPPDRDLSLSPVRCSSPSRTRSDPGPRAPSPS